MARKKTNGTEKLPTFRQARREPPAAHTHVWARGAGKIRCAWCYQAKTDPQVAGSACPGQPPAIAVVPELLWNA